MTASLQESYPSVESRVNRLTEALENQYRGYHKRMIVRNSEGEMSEYSKGQLAALENGTAKLMKFRVASGRKYYKLIQQDYDTFRDRNEYRDGSVHAFIDKKTGEVYKPAGWQAPAKHVRYELMNDESFQTCIEHCDWAGGYLYMR